jgi:hypothetical protein
MNVPYIPGHAPRRVINEAPGLRIPGARTRNRSPLVMDGRWGARGVVAVAAALAVLGILDGAILMFLARWQ